MSQTPKNWLLRQDWLWDTIAIVLLAVNLALLALLVPKYTSGQVDVTALGAIVVQAIVAALNAGTLTKPGQRFIKHLLVVMRLPKVWWHEMRALASLLVFVALLCGYSALPQISHNYQVRGWEAFESGRYGEAKMLYDRALSLNSDNLEVRFLLGIFYESREKFDLAEEQYELALELEDPAVYNNLARLYVKDDRYAAATSLLLNGLRYANKEQQVFLYKNLGAARLQLGQVPEAKIALGNAIALADSTHSVRAKIVKGESHCLLAKLLEAEKNVEEAREHWRKAIAYLSGRTIEQIQCLMQARERLQ